jgi:uncharacterized protein YutE (UPF0331/DUF86 family)
MVDTELVAAKLSELARRVKRVRVHRPGSADELGTSPDAFDLVSFNLMLAVQACLDVASHLIADERWAPARDLGGSFERLAEHGVIRKETAAALRRASGLRNVVAHVYGKADPELVFAAATEGLEDLDRFASEVAAWTKAAESGSEPGSPPAPHS